MKEPKLIAALKLLEVDELKSFGKYLLMNTGEASINFHLCTHLIKNIKSGLSNIEIKKIKENYFAEVSDKSFANAMTKLFNWLEEWFVIQEMNKAKYLSELLLLKAYNRRGNYELAEGVVQKFKKYCGEHDGYESEKIEYEWKFNHELHYSNNPAKYQMGGKLLEEIVRSFLINTKLFLQLYQAEMYNFGRINQYDYVELLDISQVLIDNLELTNSSDLVADLVIINKSINEEVYIKLLQAVFNGRVNKNSQFHTLLVHYLVTKGLNYWGKGKFSDNPELLLDIYNYGFSSGALTDNGKISKISFQNIVSTISYFSDFDQTHKFIKEWHLKVYSKKPKSVYNLAMAQNCLYNSKLEQIIDYTLTTDFETYEEKGRAQLLSLISYYSDRTKNYELFYRSHANFNAWLERHKNDFSQNLYEGYDSVLKLLVKFVKSDFEVVRIDMTEYKNIIYRKWCEIEYETNIKKG